MKRVVPGAMALLAGVLLVVASAAGLALERFASGRTHEATAATTSSLRGGHDPSGFSTDTPSAAKGSYRPQRRAALVSPGFFRALTWMPLAPVAEKPHKSTKNDSHRCSTAKIT